MMDMDTQHLSDAAKYGDGRTTFASIGLLACSIFLRWYGSLDFNVLSGWAHTAYHMMIDALSGASVLIVFILNWKKFRALFNKKSK